MTGALSLYLDALRFGAAFTVFLSHYATGRISGGMFWYLADYGRTAVLVFFVLSGYVIAWVTEARERTIEEYALSRAARLYSVIIPAFIVTAGLDYTGHAIDPRLYGPEWGHSTTHPAFGYALSALFLGESWELSALPGFNVPFWSLNYEAWYYVLFAAATFLRGGRRIAAVGLAALLAGPKVLVLLPVWLMGAAAWRYRAALPKRLGGPLVIVSLAGLIAIETLGGQPLFRHSTTHWLPPGYSAYDYILGAIVALFIVGLANLQPPMPGLRLQRAVRGLAGTAFGLYLLHYPLLNFFGTVIPGPPDWTVHRLLVFGLALGGALGLARLIEPQRGAEARAACGARCGDRETPAAGSRAATAFVIAYTAPGDVVMSEPEWHRANRANWDERVDVHVGPGGYDLSDLRAGRGRLNAIEEAELPPVQGKRVAHLQCHFGRDSLMLAQRGAEVTGLDFSAPAIDVARGLASELGLADRARFVHADLYDALEAIPAPHRVDLVFVTWGAICWLPDIARWAAIVTALLRPGGSLYLAEGHPAAYVFDDETGSPDGMPGWFAPYFSREPVVATDPGDYVDPQARLTNTTIYNWIHPIGEVVTNLIESGMTLDWLHEHDGVAWHMFRILVEDASGLYRWPGKPWLPLAFSSPLPSADQRAVDVSGSELLL